MQDQVTNSGSENRKIRKKKTQQSLAIVICSMHTCGWNAIDTNLHLALQAVTLKKKRKLESETLPRLHESCVR